MEPAGADDRFFKEQGKLGATLGATQFALLLKPGKATTGDSPISRPKNP